MTPELPFALTLGAFTFLLTAIWGDPFVEVLRRLRVGKQIRDSGPRTHFAKTGTPTMGGILILVPVVLITLGLNLARLVRETLTGSSILLPLFVLLAYGLLGAVDDLEGIRGLRERGEGMRARTKFAVQVLLAVFAAVVMAFVGGGFQNANGVYVPLYPDFVELPPLLWIPIAVFFIVGMSNAVNIVDGLDGLAGLIAASAFAAYGAIAHLQGQTFLVQFSFIIVGACFGFLWYNALPAQMFMGDVGSLALGAALGTVALMTGQWLLLPIIAIIPVAGTLSVMLQVAYFRLTHGQRLFRMTPLHHHFELGGWSETQVVQRFWLVSILAAMLGVALALLR
ncbi:MAG: phospho-N-acetylmuramoyl-pentapeptide-transferase [Anaerolineae bacterium]|nr:phospho-N-acetylmuramoyl-pentapeptide-transferase [Anaerolineae bacterium]MEB2289322.1 phospho-N-acetylmuramoyl-pentapeptide-transferase [Anaerolineae bacterium]